MYLCIGGGGGGGGGGGVGGEIWVRVLGEHRRTHAPLAVGREVATVLSVAWRLQHLVCGGEI